MSNTDYTGTLDGRPITVRLSPNAASRLQSSGESIYVEMKLYFSCFIKKITKIKSEKPAFDVVQVADQIYVYFRPVQTKACNIQDLDADSKPDLIEFTVKRKNDIVPRYLSVDYKKGKWTGDFTWKSGNDEIKPMVSNY